MREQFDSLQEQHSGKVRQLERLQSEVTSIALNDDGIQGSFHSAGAAMLHHGKPAAYVALSSTVERVRARAL